MTELGCTSRPARLRRRRAPPPPPFAVPSPSQASEEIEEGEERIKNAVDTAVEILPSPLPELEIQDLLTFGINASAGECKGCRSTKGSTRHVTHPSLQRNRDDLTTWVASRLPVTQIRPGMVIRPTCLARAFETASPLC